MSLDRNSSAVISLGEAVDFTHSFQLQNPDATKSFFAGSDKLKMILDQEGCIGIRMYNGYDTMTASANLVLVGVDAEGEDISTGVILERLILCPHVCPKSSPLIATP